MSIGLDDAVEVMGDESPSAAWLEATVVRVDKPNGLYCVARASSGGTFFVGLSQLRLVTKAGRRATTCAADAAFLKEIETWSEEKLRTMQDCLSVHDQHLVAVVRQRRNHDQQWGAVVARRRKLAEEWAAAAPARAARNKRKREREREERARAPPPTRASHPRPAYVNRHLGHVGGRARHRGAPPHHLPAPPLAPRRATRRTKRRARTRSPRSTVFRFSFDHHSVGELAAFGVVEVGMYLAPTIPNYDTYVDKYLRK